MQLCIGKNHQADTAPVQSIFRLVGSDEDALTYALGFLLAYAPTFCAKIVRRFGVAPRKTFKRGYSIHLQEVTDPGFGRRDIVIEARGMRIVIEAKMVAPNLRLDSSSSMQVNANYGINMRYVQSSPSLRLNYLQ